MEIITLQEVKRFIEANYKHSRLYGRTAANGWDDGYGDRIVAQYHRDIHENKGHQFIIAKHESTTGQMVVFSCADIIRLAVKDMGMAQLIEARYQVYNQLQAMNVTADKLQKNQSLNRIFVVTNVRRNIINHRLRYGFNYLDEQTITI
ncbi:hypothetical protein [Photobacterium sp. R1]